jgi:hypothetical protein
MSSWHERINFVERLRCDSVCRAVLFKLAQRIDDGTDDTVILTAETLARFCGVTDNTLRSHLRHLDQSGYALRASRRGGSRAKYPGAAQPTLYLLNIRGLTVEQWQSERLQTPPLLLPIGAQPPAKTAVRSSGRANAQVGDQTQKLRVAADQGKHESEPTAEIAGRSSGRANAQVGDQTQKLRVAADQGKHQSEPTAEIAGGGLICNPFSPSPPGGRTDGGQIEDDNDDQAAADDSAAGAAARVDDDQDADDVAAFVDSLPWRAIPTPAQHQAHVEVIRGAVRRGWTFDALHRQITTGIATANNPDGAMASRIREAVAVMTPRRLARRPRPAQRAATVASAPVVDIERNSRGVAAARAALQSAKSTG